MKTDTYSESNSQQTNVYIQFKNWVKTTCVNKSNTDPSSHIYEGDTAHAIYTAWYMFKHNFTEEQVNEYIQKDIEQSHKTFYNHGINISLNNYLLEKDIEEDKRILIKIGKEGYWNEYHIFGGGGDMFGYLTKQWTKAVRTIWEFWELKKMEEIENV